MLLEIVLQQQPHAVRAFLAVAHRIKSITVTENEPAPLVSRGVTESATGTSLPPTWLLEAGQVIQISARSFHAQLKTIVMVQRYQVTQAQMRHAFRREFLVIVTGQLQRKLGHQRQHTAQPPRAESVRVVRPARVAAKQSLWPTFVHE